MTETAIHVEAGSAILGPLIVHSAAASHVGRVRALNEDSVLNSTRAALWAVADGMGGHQRGVYASAAIVHALGAVAPPESAPAFLAEVRMRLDAVNRELRAEAAGDGGPVASTVICLLLFGWSFACVWAGDSRLYLARDGRLHQVSRDHSAVQEMVDAGVLSPAEAAGHPRGNEVTRAVGAYDTLDLELKQGRVQPGDLFLLCSDGLTRHLSDPEILARLGEPSPSAAVEALIAAALERGGTDNVSAIAVRCVANAETADETTQVLKRRAGGGLPVA